MLIDLKRLALPETLPCVERVCLDRIWLMMSSAEVNPQLLSMHDNLRTVADSNDALLFLEMKQVQEGIGRYYHSGSLIRQKRIHRNFLTNGRYAELDIVAANPTIALSLVEALGNELVFLEQYVTHRDEFNLHIQSQRPPEFWRNETREGARFSPKLLVNSFLNGSRQIYEKMMETGPVSDAVTGLMHDLARASHVINAEYGYVEVEQNAQNANASRLSLVLQTIEAYLVCGAIERLAWSNIIEKNGNYFDCGYGYDGIFLPTSVALDDAVEVANGHMRTLRFPRIKFKLKPLEEHILQIPRLVNESVMVPRLGSFVRNAKAVIKYPTGRGKTFRSIRYACYNWDTVLIIVHRQTLAMDLKRNYPQFSCYLETDGERGRINADKQIICVNSLHRLERIINKYQVVICDEIASLLRQIVAMKVHTISSKFFERILLKENLRVLCLDALISEKESQFLHKYGSFQICFPSEVQCPRATINVIDNKKLILTLIKRDAQSGMKIWIAHSMNVEKMNGFLESLNIPFLHVTRFNKDEVAIEDFRNYSVVAFSPCIDAGVDISFFDDGIRQQYFQRGYGLFFVGTTTPQQAVQMLGRDRTCTDFYVTWFGNVTSTVFDSKRAFKDYVRARANLIQFYGLSTYVNDDFEIEVDENFNFDLAYLSNQTTAECTNSNYGKYIKYYLATNGWRIKHEALEEDEIDEAIREAQKKGVLDEYRSIAGAPVDSQFEREDMSREAYHARLADSITSAFNLFGDLSIDDFEDREAFILAATELRQKKFFCFDATGEEISFDYIKFYREHRKQFYLQKEWLQVFTNQKEPTMFRFEYLESSFYETAALLNVIVRSVGFAWNRLRVPKTQARFRNDLFSGALKGKKIRTWIANQAGLLIREDGEYYVLESTIGNGEPQENAFYLENSPLGFREPNEKVTCSTCLKQFKAGYAHQCRVMPGFQYRVHEGRRQRFCQRCNQIVDRNPARHQRRCRQ